MHWAILFLVFLGCAWAQVRMDCHPEPGASEDNCKQRGCVWTPADNSKDSVEPWCYLPPGVGYAYSSTSGSTINLKKNSGLQNPWGADIQNLQFSSNTLGSTLNVRITSGNRFEPQLDLPKNPSKSSDSLVLRTTQSDPFVFNVIRKSTSRKLFDTSIGGLIFSDKFIQIATYLPSENLYGLGENIHQTLKHDFSKYYTWGMLARDEPPNSYGTDTKNLYGVHPFYMVVEPDGNVHGVLILNSNAQEVTTTPGPALIYRTIGGMLDMYFFPGPTAHDVLRQYQDLIGRPFLPAYWGLGYQLSRYGYKDLNDMQTRIAAVQSYNIPLDTAVIDIDYMDRYKDFTIGQTNWAGLSSYISTKKSEGLKFILIFDPAIQADYDSFQRGIDQGAKFIEWERADQVMHEIQDQYPLANNTKIMLGVVWPDKHTAFPDFLDSTNKTQQWWISEFVRFQKQAAFDGIWIDMNEPSSFGTNEDHPWYFDSADHPDDLPLRCPINASDPDSVWDMPPYKTHNVWNYQDQEYLSTKTLCMSAVQDGGKQRFYNVKNLYGWSESKYTQQAMYASTNKRGVVVSRSTFPSSGRFTGHWLGDNTARWEDLRTSVIGAQEFNLFGIPYVGSDICGFIQQTTEELCLRWQQMGAFHSFMRNHNDISSPPQDPAIWPSVAAATKKANLFRYRYLPYLYSLHFNAWANSGSVIRPMFFEFPNDSETYNLSYQYMWGPSFMVAPVVYQGATEVNLYIPDNSFYSVFDYNYGQKFDAGSTIVPAPNTSLIPTFVREGSIIPRQTPDITTTASRKKPFEVLIAPMLSSQGYYKATGELYWDDGESIVTDVASADFWHIQYNFNSDLTNSQLSYSILRQAANVKLPTLDIIEIFNFPASPLYDTFKFNGKTINIDLQCSQYSPFTKIFTICANKFLDLSSNFTLSWKNSPPLVLSGQNKQFHDMNYYQINL